jgi:hypothetical protein
LAAVFAESMRKNVTATLIAAMIPTTSAIHAT